MAVDGGGAAAFGFRYQYLATAEEILRVVSTHSGDIADLSLLVEPTRRELGNAPDVDDDVVDFAVEAAGATIRRVQVKASRHPSGLNPLRNSDATKIFNRMGQDAVPAVILTNKPLAKKLLKACTAAAPGSDRRLFTPSATNPTPERGISTDRSSMTAGHQQSSNRLSWNSFARCDTTTHTAKAKRPQAFSRRFFWTPSLTQLRPWRCAGSAHHTSSTRAAGPVCRPSRRTDGVRLRLDCEGAFFPVDNCSSTGSGSWRWPIPSRSHQHKTLASDSRYTYIAAPKCICAVRSQTATPRVDSTNEASC